MADIGDVAINTFNLLEAVRIIEQEYDRILGHGILPLTLGGDHTITLPILRAIKKKHGKVGLVHVDAHADVNDHMFGEKIAHGTTFRRAVEEDLLDCDRVVQIGLRAQGYTAEDFNWSRKQGFRVVQAEECWHKSLEPLMAEVRGEGRRRPRLPELRHRRHRPGLGARHRHPEIGGLTTIRRWKSSAAARAWTWSAATWSKSHRPTTPPATLRCWAPTCSMKCSASSRAWCVAEP